MINLNKNFPAVLHYAASFPDAAFFIVITGAVNNFSQKQYFCNTLSTNDVEYMLITLLKTL
jgi:hypothetical protein